MGDTAASKFPAARRTAGVWWVRDPAPRRAASVEKGRSLRLADHPGRASGGRGDRGRRRAGLLRGSLGLATRVVMIARRLAARSPNRRNGALYVSAPYRCEQAGDSLEPKGALICFELRPGEALEGQRCLPLWTPLLRAGGPGHHRTRGARISRLRRVTSSGLPATARWDWVPAAPVGDLSVNRACASTNGYDKTISPRPVQGRGPPRPGTITRGRAKFERVEP
jgi:hypothetical protein